MRVNINQIMEMKQKGEKISMLTAYDYSTAKIVDEVGIPMILVGDSLGMVMLGYDTTLPVTMEVMLHHTKAVVRGTQRALIVGDMPFMTYHVTVEDCIKNAGRFIQEAGCQAIKLEGGVTVAEKVRKVVDCGIPVMGHIGLTPQSIYQVGGYRVQGRTAKQTKEMVKEAQALEEAGAFSIVIELAPSETAKVITETLGIPTIGIGAGPHCDGQVLVLPDMLGLFQDFKPKFVKRYANIREVIEKAVREFSTEVREGQFPDPDYSFEMTEEETGRLYGRTKPV